MNIYFLTLSSFFLISTVADAQSEGNFSVEALNRRMISRRDTSCYFYAVRPEHPVKLKKELTYFWYRPDTILSTAGGYDGRLLDGVYKVFYPDKNLKEQGIFRTGLKTGEWKDWYEGGRLCRITHWDRGMKNGAFEEYSTDGKLVRKGKYKNNVLHGTLSEYDHDGRVHASRYKNGVLRADAPVKKEKKKKTSKQIPAPDAQKH